MKYFPGYSRYPTQATALLNIALTSHPTDDDIAALLKACSECQTEVLPWLFRVQICYRFLCVSIL